MKLHAYVISAILGLSAFPFTLHAAEVEHRPHLVTSGEASIEVMPDMATLTAEVSVFDKDVRVAKKNVDIRVAEYLDFLEKNGIERKDIEAANLRTRAEYSDKKAGAKAPRGYRALRYVQVTVRQLDKLTVLLDATLKSGLHEIHTLEFGVTDREGYREQVRQKAIANAVQQANSLAKGFSVRLGAVFSIRYLPVSHQPALLTRMYKAAESEASVAQTYEPQAMRFDDRVEVVFELQR